MTTIIDAIKKLDAKAQVTVSNENIDKIIWHDKNPNNISKSEIQSKLQELNNDFKEKQYQRDRLYPDLGEQLDMLFHDMTAGKGDKTGEWYKAISKVKSDHPKP